MALFGSSRDLSFFRIISKEFVDRIVSEEVGYYKLSLAETQTNIYGESKNKMYYNPVLLTCLWEPQDQNTDDSKQYGSDRSQLIDFKFLRYDLIQLNLLPEPGDIILWQENYYEVDAIIENQRIVGKNPEYGLEMDLKNFGDSWSIICRSHLTRLNKLNIVKSR